LKWSAIVQGKLIGCLETTVVGMTPYIRKACDSVKKKYTPWQEVIRCW
jgi:hypothetical protein